MEPLIDYMDPLIDLMDLLIDSTLVDFMHPLEITWTSFINFMDLLVDCP